MAENWANVAAEVAAAIADVGTPITLEKPATTGPTTPWDTTPVGTKPTFTLYAVPDTERHRDASGTLIGTTRDTLLVQAVGVVPAKGDRVHVKGTWREIDTADVLWQGGVDLLYTLGLVK